MSYPNNIKLEQGVEHIMESYLKGNEECPECGGTSWSKDDWCTVICDDCGFEENIEPDPDNFKND